MAAHRDMTHFGNTAITATSLNELVNTYGSWVTEKELYRAAA